MSELLRYLHVVAHSDDVDFGSAGTTAALTAEGHEVVYCLVTDGQAGGFDRAVSRRQIAQIRREEQTAAAKVVGVGELYFLGFDDGLEATLNAVYPDARNEFAFPELLSDELEPHTVSEVWLTGTADVDHYVDITATFDRRVEALLCHQSQLRDPGRLPDMMRDWATVQATRAGWPAGRLAEGFRRVKTG